MYKKLGIKQEIIELAEKVEQEIQEEFKKIDKIKEYNSIKVLKAMQKNKISDMHFHYIRDCYLFRNSRLFKRYK
mgnify:CR=1 FL=1